MAIIRGPRLVRDFSILSNAVLRDERLSYRARGVLGAIVSRPDDWVTDSTKLAQQGKEGREAVRSALDELEEFGYLTRRRRQDEETGKWITEFTIYAQGQEPAGHTEDGFPGVGSPGVGFPGAIRSTETKNPNEESASEQAPTTFSASPTSSPTPQIPNPRGWTDWRAEDRVLWENTLEDLGDYTPAELDEIYVHWCQRFDWPGKFAESMAVDHRLDGFLGSSGIDLGLYDEDDADDPWAS